MRSLPPRPRSPPTETRACSRTTESLDACHRLRSEVPAYTSRQLSRSQGGGHSEDTTSSEPSDSANRLPSYLHQCSMYLRMCGCPLLGGLATSGAMLMEADRQTPLNYVELIKRSMGDKNFRRTGMRPASPLPATR